MCAEECLRCGYNRDVQRSFHIAVPKRQLVTKGGHVNEWNVERQRFLDFFLCLTTTSHHHPSNEIYTTVLILLSRYSPFSTSRHKCYKSETKASGKEQAQLGTETVQGAPGTLQSIDHIESGHGFPTTMLRRCIIVTLYAGHTA